jgi:hypothetical protein
LLDLALQRVNPAHMILQQTYIHYTQIFVLSDFYPVRIFTENHPMKIIQTFEKGPQIAMEFFYLPQEKSSRIPGRWLP